MSVTGIAPTGSGVAAVTARIEAIRAQFVAPSRGDFATRFAAAATTPAAPAPVTLPAGTSPSTAVALAQLTGSATGAATTAPAAGAGRAAGTAEQKVVAAAREFVGVPYVWGGNSRTGVDCSGLMIQVFSQFGIDLPRVSKDQATAGRPVATDDLRPGDMVFFDYSSSRPGIDHVALYIGDGKVIHAPRPGERVQVAPLHTDAIVSARRVLPAEQAPAARAAGGPDAVPGALDVTKLPAQGKAWADEVTAAATRAGVDPKLLAALVWSESGFNAQARSSAGAIGLGQLMPGTAAELGVNPYRPAENLKGAATYLAQQIRTFGSEELALAAYNAGPGAVRKYGDIPPYAETRAYVRTVMDRYSALGGSR